MDTVIRGGLVITSGGVSRADVGIDNEKIVSVGTELPAAANVIDATGSYVMPGGVDCHVHLNTISAMTRGRADDFYHGTRAAAAGGITTIADFAPQAEGGSLRDALDQSVAAAEANAVIDFSLHITIADPSPDAIAEVAGLVADGFPSFKFFTPRPAFNSRGGEYLRFLQAVSAAGGMAMFHCEDLSILDYSRTELLNAGKTGLKYYPASRPRQVEIGATERAMQIAEITGVPMYVVHLSCEAALDATRRARARGVNVYVETRPIYLYLTEERFFQEDAEAAKYVGVPPLRDRHDLEVLWNGLQRGDVHTVQTDHVGYSYEQKYREGDTFSDVPAGMSNLETLVPMIHSEGVLKGRVSLERWVEVISTNPAKLFGMYPRKGTIAPGADADICIFDPAKKKTVHSPEMHSATDYDVYEGFEVTGWPVLTMSRGDVVFKDGEVTAAKGRGKVVPRTKFRGL